MGKFWNKILIIFLFLFVSCNQSGQEVPVARDGKLDLSEWDFEKQGSVSLDGSWEFYIDRLYTPQDFQSRAFDTALNYLRVPGRWNSLFQEKGRHSGLGFGTYRLKIKMHHSYPILAVKLLDAASSYKLWINNELVAENGIVSSDLRKMKPQLLPQVVNFILDSNRIDLLIQVANNFHFKGGLWEVIHLGTPEQMMRLREGSLILTMFLSGTLFILFVYHLWIFFLRRTEKAALWFGILCLCVLIRTLCINERIIYYLFPGFSLNIGYRLEYISLFSLSLFFGFYHFYLFKNSVPKTALRIIGFITGLQCALILCTPTSFYTSFVLVFQIIMYCTFLYFFILTFRQVMHRKQAAVLLLLSYFVVMIVGFNDILHINMVINTGIFAHYGFFVFLLTQAYILSFKIAGAFRQVEDLSFNLEHKVALRTQELGEEKKKSDNLLLNILPAEVAEELKLHGRSSAKTFGMVTVMITDFKDFSDVSEKVSPELLVTEIDYCFSAFDNIIQKYGIEKIKTVGDAYICAGGLPVLTYTHAVDTVRAAIEIKHFILRRSVEKKAKGELPFELRIGIHTGPVVAGIVGVRKFAYDIWGDTVNLAARMESGGMAGKINISGATYQLVKEKFVCTFRGRIEAKHKGEVEMYFVESEK